MVNVVPSSEYCQVPSLVGTLIIAIPSVAFVFVSLMAVPEELLMKLVKRMVSGAEGSVLPSDGEAAVRLGATLATVTGTKRVSLLLLKNEVPLLLVEATLGIAVTLAMVVAYVPSSLPPGSWSQP